MRAANLLTSPSLSPSTLTSNPTSIGKEDHMNLLNCARIFIAIALATLGISFQAAATVTYSWSAGANCGNAPVANFSPGGAPFQASLCASTTAPSEAGCGFSAVLLSATPAESGAFSVTARTLGSNYPDPTSAPILPFLITNPPPSTPVAVDFGGTVALASAAIPPALNQLLATFTFQPQASATNAAYVIGLNAASEFSTAAGSTCLNAASSSSLQPTAAPCPAVFSSRIFKRVEVLSFAASIRPSTPS